MSVLFTPVTVGGLELQNRIVIAPMCQYSAVNGCMTDWHVIHLGHLALSGAGLLTIEATAVLPEGRITHADVGLWSDETEAALGRVLDAIRRWSDMPIALQLAHAGRKASTEVPWKGGAQIPPEAENGWQTAAPSALSFEEAGRPPAALDGDGLARVRDAFAAAASRAGRLGLDAVQIHVAHGYLLHEFLSPLSNKRSDAYGGDRAGRMTFPLEIIATVRAAWPSERPLFVRISAVDGVEGGLDMADTLAFVGEAKARGVDVIDCSSGGLMGSATAARIPRGYGFQVPFAEQVRRDAEIATMAVGLILHPQQAEALVVEGKADLVAIGREALFDPNWPLHAELALADTKGEIGDGTFDSWPQQYGWWLERREPGLRKLDGPALPYRKA